MDKVEELQENWLGSEHCNHLNTWNKLSLRSTALEVTKLFNTLQSVLTEPNWPSINPEYNFTILFLTSDTFAMIGVINDCYYECHLALFTFDRDNPDCCQ